MHMRMRRKKHREDRLENCSDIIIDNIMDYSKDINAVFNGSEKPLRLEIGCGKGKFITETAMKLKTSFIFTNTITGKLYQSLKM